MNPIKIVIWDLDETFWKGTLSEGGIEAVPANLAAVAELTQRGIIHSIASKNDKAEARKQLEHLAVWDQFVFPEIDWQPKGPAVKRILENCRLRAANALFLDDNPANRKEVEFYNPEIASRGPEFLPQLLSHPALRGKPDPSRKRLEQYKLLERRSRESLAFADNTEFLRQSQIRVEILRNLGPHTERIVELIQRTNQLNFTKERIGQAALEDLLVDPENENGAVVVRDRYGDYGVAGFYSLDRRRRRLNHFLFSCRLLHLGIEQWLYAKLRHPTVEVRGEVAATLDRSPPPDWIEELQAEKQPSGRRARPSVRVLLKGGCDLEQMAHYLAFDGLDVERELTYVGTSGEPIHNEDTTLLRLGAEADPARLETIIEGLPFCDRDMFRTRMFNPGHDAVVYSILMDCTRHLYRHRATGVEIPYGEANLFAAQPKTGGSDPRKWLTPEFLAWFGRRFEHAGPISPESFLDNLEFMHRRVRAPLIFINAAEVAHPSDPGGQQLRRHRLLNQLLDDFVEDHGDCYLLDVRPIINSPGLLIDSVRHYNRIVYPDMARELVRLLAGIEQKTFEPRRWQLRKNAALHSLKHLKRRWQLPA